MKVIVIADDFSGAAEMAGIALRYGLKLNVCLNSLEMLNNSSAIREGMGALLFAPTAAL